MLILKNHASVRLETSALSTLFSKGQKNKAKEVVNSAEVVEKEQFTGWWSKSLPLWPMWVGRRGLSFTLVGPFGWSKR